MKKLMFATALVASAAAFADVSPTALNAISFEGYSADATFANGDTEKDESGNDKTSTGPFFYFDGEGDASSVKLFTTGDAGAANCPRPYYFQGVSPAAKYLELSTEGGTLWRSINAITETKGGEGEPTTYGLGTGQAIAADGTYLDTLVQFTPTEDGGAPELTQDDKLAIWLNVDSNGVTNLMVKAAVLDLENSAPPAPTTFTITNKAVSAGQWYRLTVKAIPDIAAGEGYPGFQIKLDNQLLVSDTLTMTAESISLVESTGADVTDLQNGAVFASLGGMDDNPTLQGVGFKGSGALDDIVWTEDDLFAIPAGIDFTLTWPSGLTAVSYTVGNGEPVAISGTSPLTIHDLADGATVKFVVQNADGAQKTLTGTTGTDQGIDATGTTFTWADYLGAAVDGAYEIDDANDLDMLRKGVLSGLATANETFKQTANIDMTSAPAFAGIGEYNANPTSGTPFAGTYDGQGFKIENITMTARNYGGVFNQVNGGTIQNLTVENISVASGATGEYGYAIVGNAGNGATLQNLVAAGSFLSAGTPGTHNMAGIVVRECGGGANGSLIKDCTNNATIYGDYTKLAGICALTQLKVSGGGPATFDGCVNNGTLISARTSEANAASAITGIAGIVGYTADATVLKDCVNNGTITVALANQKVGELVGSGGVESGSLTDAGGNKADATKKMVHTRSVVTGFLYAIVENGVATTVLPPLTAGATYLLESNVAASETPVFTLAAAGDTIAFDTALGYTFAGTIAGAQGLTVTDATVGTVTTYTAAAAGGDDYVVEIDGSDVVVTPSAEDLAVVQAAVIAGGGTLDVTDVAAVNAAMAAPIGTTGIPSWQALFLGLPPTEAGLASFKIDSISFDADGKVVVTLPDGVDPKTGRGVTITIKLMKADTPNAAAADWTQVETAGGSDNKTFAPVTPGSGDTKKFYKVVVEYSGSSN